MNRIGKISSENCELSSEVIGMYFDQRMICVSLIKKCFERYSLFVYSRISWNQNQSVDWFKFWNFFKITRTILKAMVIHFDIAGEIFMIMCLQITHRDSKGMFSSMKLCSGKW